MKQFLFGCAIGLVVGLGFLIAAPEEEWVEIDRHDDGAMYEVHGIVTDVLKQMVTVNVDMPNGEIHEFVAYGNGYQNGQLITLTLNDSGTPEYDDDVVEGIAIM